MLQKATQVAQTTFDAWHRTVDKTPIVGRVHGWAAQGASTSKSARYVLGGVVVLSTLMVLTTLGFTLYFLLNDKIDAVGGTLLGIVFTVLSGIMGITVPAYINAIKISRASNELA